MEDMVRVLPFQRLLGHVFETHKGMQLLDLHEIVDRVFDNFKGEQIVLFNANNAIFKVNTELF